MTLVKKDIWLLMERWPEGGGRFPGKAHIFPGLNVSDPSRRRSGAPALYNLTQMASSHHLKAKQRIGGAHPGLRGRNPTEQKVGQRLGRDFCLANVLALERSRDGNNVARVQHSGFLHTQGREVASANPNTGASNSICGDSFDPTTDLEALTRISKC